MPDNVPAHYATEFSRNWIQRAQQMKARFDEFVVDENFDGERKRYDRLFKQDSTERQERKAPTPVTDPGSDSRWVYRRTFDIANTLAEEDSRNLAPLLLPTSDYVASHSFAYHRDCDRVAYQAALNDAMTGEAGTTPSALPSGQKVVADATGLTIAKLLKVVEILNGADLFDDPNSRILTCAPQQITNLLNTTEVKSADYNTVKALAEGKIDTFMGFKFKISNLLNKVSTTRQCAAWVKGAIKRTKGSMRSTIDRLPQQTNATQILSMWDLAAVRVYDEGVVQIDCIEA